MKAIKTYPTRIEADLAKIALDAAWCASVSTRPSRSDERVAEQLLAYLRSSSE